MNNKNHKKIIIVTIIILLLGCVIFVVEKQIDRTFFWKTYVNSKYQYSIQYPARWFLNETDQSHVLFSSPETRLYSDLHPNENIQNYDFIISVYKKRSLDPVNWERRDIFMDGFVDGAEMIIVTGAMSSPESYLTFRKEQNEYLITYPTTSIESQMVRSFEPGV